MASTTVTGVELTDAKLFRQACYVDGQWVAAKSGGVINVDNPATGDIVGTVPKLGAVETREAIEAADRALPAWRKKTAKERAAALRTWYELMLENQEDLAKLMTTEQGKPLVESRGEVVYAASFLEWFGEEAKRVYGDTIPGHQPDKRIVVIKQPIGVVACITPWNFPLAMITRKAGPAIASGCTELTANPIVRKLSFTGSTEVGKVLMQQCASTVKKLSLELGGNAPFIVFDDADLDAAVEGAIASKYRNTGQTCVCVNRIYVQDRVYDAFAAKLADAVKKLKPAPGLEPGATQGPLIDDKAVAKVEEHIEDALGRGARVVVGGKRHALGGRFFEPTVLADVATDALMAREETFGPVAPLFRFKTEEEAIGLANNTEFGLAAYFYGRDIGRVWRVAESLESGMVGINTGIISTEVAPFGGVKESGLGREGSKYGIEEYLEIKYLCLGGI
jgi:succinate-semialdehyde dehydrogenase/glutarate-semialdehyde dehydrogenase